MDRGSRAEMSVVKVLSAVVVLLLSSLACEQAVVTVTPTTLAEAVTTPDNTLPPTPTPSPVPTAADVATILRPVVNLRAEAGGAVVESVTAGTVVTVIECGPEWCQVEYMEQIFYVYRGCLDGYADGRGCEAK
jgi:uncharacterized protein YgiM (DUF1202 family)